MPDREAQQFPRCLLMLGNTALPYALWNQQEKWTIPLDVEGVSREEWGNKGTASEWGR